MLLLVGALFMHGAVAAAPTDAPSCPDGWLPIMSGTSCLRLLSAGPETLDSCETECATNDAQIAGVSSLTTVALLAGGLVPGSVAQVWAQNPHAATGKLKV